jgi:hypothetical protein
MKIPTYREAEVRMHRAFEWLMRHETERWERFRRVRDRLRPYRMPLRYRVELSLNGLAGGGCNLSDDTLAFLRANNMME